MASKIITKDGSTTFHSAWYDETYHSVSGAKQEAVEKYAKPCRIGERKEAVLLDICFGLGYNSAAAVDMFSGKKMKIIALENDPSIVSEILNIEYPFKCAEMMRKVAEEGKYSGTLQVDSSAAPRQATLVNTSTATDMLKNAAAFLAHQKPRGFLSVPRRGQPPCRSKSLRSQTLRKTGGGAAEIEIELIIGDARETIKKLKTSFDVVFLDPFSPSKCPEMWKKEFFDDVYRVMKKKGILATYSCAGSVRRALKEAGFSVSDGPCVGRRSPSTLATKD